MMEDESQTRPAQIEVSYYGEGSKPLLKVVRCIGLLGIIYGSISLAILPIYELYRENARRANPVTETWFTVLNVFLGAGMTVILNCFLVIAGVGFLRKRPKGRRLMIVWAWMNLTFTAYIIVVTAGYFASGYYARYSFQRIAISYGYELRMWASDLVLPLAVVFLMRLEVMRELFESGPTVGD